jgi:cysteine desulfurase
MLAALDLAGNPSSIHAEGRAARHAIETARAEIASFVGTAAKNVIFTSGATEALNLALAPGLQIAGNRVTGRRSDFDRLFIAGGEHACVREGHRFCAESVEVLPLTATGELDLAALDAALARHHGQRIMLALQAANNETGVVQPVKEAAERVHAAGGFVVCDAVQAAGRVETRFAALGADALALSAHKLGGPKGIGTLCFAADGHHMNDRLLRGGGQERGWRAGTENVLGIAGFAGAVAALVAAGEAEVAALSRWRDRLEDDVRERVPNAVIFGAEAQRLPNTSCFAVPGIEAHVLLMSLDVEGVAVSSGAACSSGKVKPSHVLAAMGVAPDLAKGAIRVSLGWNSRIEDLDAFARAFEKAIRTIGANRMKPAA